MSTQVYSDLLVVGDVHGCYYTLKELVQKNWDPETSLLIQVGDLVNKGPNSDKCIRYWRKLSRKYPERVILLRGNHEQMLLKAIKHPFLLNASSRLRSHLRQSNLKLDKLSSWLDSLPLKWENEHILVTHAGISKAASDPYRKGSRFGVLRNKGPLQYLDKVQVKGHSVVQGHKPVFNAGENAWYLDTGAWSRKYLSAIRLDPQGKMMEVIRQPTDQRDKAQE